MAIDPSVLPKNAFSGTGESPLANIKPENFLMAAAQMHQMGRFAQRPPKEPSGIQRPNRGKGLKLVK